MTKLRKWSILTHLVEQMRQSGSWSGETHVQKAVFFLQELTEVNLGFEFMLYKHGPFSFDLTDELGMLKSARVLDPEPQAPYGPRLKPLKRFDDLSEGERDRIRFVASALGERGVGSLEQIGTALLVRAEGIPRPTEQESARLLELKPHLTQEQADEAFRELNLIIQRFQTERPGGGQPPARLLETCHQVSPV